MFRRMILVGVAPAAVQAGSTRPLAQQVAGTWQVEYPAQVRNQNGQETVKMGRARLTIEVKGDSLIGTWLSLDNPDARPSELRGTVKGAAVAFVRTVKGQINVNGDVRGIEMRVEFNGTVSGDQISGTMQSHASDGSIHSQVKSWTGLRLRQSGA